MSTPCLWFDTMTVEFELNGQPFLALNGGPQFTFTEAVSFQIMCRPSASWPA
jgi:predicted 3-demethylubiquinone-9 3-methyltransferase (glyoxalase superfamily)